MDEKNQTIVQIGNNLYDSIKNVLAQARQTACRAVNFTMVTAYWEIGRLITEDELHNQRADYGKFVLKNLAERLSKEFGKDLMKAICVICDCFTRHSQFVTHCVTN